VTENGGLDDVLHSTFRRETMRRLFLVVLAIALVGVGWSAGRAQSAVADFEIAIEAPRGELKLRCHRGCDWVTEGTTPVPTITFPCETERCRGTFNGHGRITMGMPR
jgi:hypothetical protein